MVTSTPAVVTRPYTSYNLFFQLERQYILQTLGFQAQIVLADVFDPGDARANYHGPPLPSRYADLILPYDWHIPGKTQRRKRSHRKTHGKIGFHELNNKISKSWSVVDDETRTFCMNLADIESRKYKRVKKAPKKAVEKRKINMSKKTMSDSDNDLVASFDWTVAFPQDDFVTNQPHYEEDNILVQPNIFRMVSHGSDDKQHHEDLSSIHRVSFTEVDMADDEIIDIWKSIPMEDERSMPFVLSACQVCVEIPVDTCSTTNPIQEDDGSQKDGTRTSFINAEYDMFKKIGKQFSTNKQKLPNVLMRKAITARQA